MFSSQIKRKTIRISETIGIYLIHTRSVYKWISGRNTVVFFFVSAVYIYPEYISQEVLLNILSVAPGIYLIPVINMARANVIAIASVSYRNVQVPIRPKGNCTTIVIGLGVIGFENNPFRTRISLVWVSHGSFKFRNACQVIPGSAWLWSSGDRRGCIEKIKFTILPVIWMKGKSE